MATLLMCEPTHYGIEYEINPWMSRERNADAALARSQWNALYRTLVDTVGAKVELIDPVPGLPDLVFTANAGLVCGNVVIRSSFRFKERAREEPVWDAWFAHRGYRVLSLPPAEKFEGEGDALFAGHVLYAGWGFRSGQTSHRAVQKLIGGRVVSLALANPYFYHLDTCFAPLSRGRLMYYPDAFTPDSQRRIEECFPERIEVNEAEARRFVCNMVVIGNRVVTSAQCPRATAALQEWGYQVFPVETSEFVKSGGSAKCMVLFLDRECASVTRD